MMHFIFGAVRGRARLTSSHQDIDWRKPALQSLVQYLGWLNCPRTPFSCFTLCLRLTSWVVFSFFEIRPWHFRCSTRKLSPVLCMTSSTPFVCLRQRLTYSRMALGSPCPSDSPDSTWSYRQVPPCLVYVVVWIKPRAPRMLATCFTCCAISWPHPVSVAPIAFCNSPVSSFSSGAIVALKNSATPSHWLILSGHPEETWSWKWVCLVSK